MKTNLLLLFVAAVLATTNATAVEIDKLEASIETLQAYEYDKTGGVDLNWVESQVGMASADGSVREQVEAKLVESLAAAKTNDARQFLCRQLRTVGTARCVPQLASLLGDAGISHMACYALGRIEAPEAGEALHKALATTSGRIKAGIIDALVQADRAAAAPDIAKLVSDRDKDVALAAIRATPHLGTADDVKTLQKLRGSAAKDVQVEIDAAILGCADRLVARGGKKAAIEIYRHYYEGEFPEHLRTAGLRGLALASDGDSAALLVEAVKGDDPAIRRNAVAMMALIEGGKTTSALVGLCASVPPDTRELIVRSLAARGDVSAAPALIGMLGGEDENVRIAVLEALGELANPDSIPHLARVAATGSTREKLQARSSLARMRGGEIDKAMIPMIRSGDPEIRLEIIRAVGQRLDHEPFTALQEVARADDDSGLRREAIMSMGRIGSSSDLPAIVQLSLAPRDPADLRAIERAVLVVFGRTSSSDEQAQALLAALKSAPDASKPTLLKLLATPGTDRAFKEVSSAVASGNSEVSNAAIRALCEWPGAAPVEQLYRIASTSDDEGRRSQALRGYVRLAPMTPDPTSCFVSALKLARNDDEKRHILGGLQHAGTRKALEIAESYMDHPELKADAYRAAVEVLSVYCWQDRVRAAAALERIAADAPDDGVRNRAKDVLKKINEYKGVITAWKGTRLFTIPDIVDGARVFGTEFEPEKNFDSADINWRIVLPEFEGGGRIDLEKTYGVIDFCCAYLRTTIHSPAATEARLQWQVDDSIRGWLNGRPVNAGPIKLEEGPNTFIVKVGDNSGGWSFRCEILKPDGSPLEELRFEL